MRTGLVSSLGKVVPTEFISHHRWVRGRVRESPDGQYPRSPVMDTQRIESRILGTPSRKVGAPV